ncbi:MAG: formyl transferase [Rhizobiaceae bacterium]|nr:formyl transferase [Rhizobiaceae bacterium]
MSDQAARRAGPIVVATAGGPHPWIVVNALADAFGDVVVIQEGGEPRSTLVRRRARRFGWWNALGQAGTMAWSVIGKRLARRRIDALIAVNGLNPSPRPGQTVVDVSSVNAPQFIGEIARLKPAVLFLVGCRMLKAETLTAIPCPVLNYHAGITPKYRGMNGGYYAMAEGDAENFGGTVHLVDPGVDTGGVLYQAHGAPAPDDDILTYAYRQAAISRDICVQSVRDALGGNLRVIDPRLPSKQWFHPTIWRYVWTGVTKGVW